MRSFKYLFSPYQILILCMVLVMLPGEAPFAATPIDQHCRLHGQSDRSFDLLSTVGLHALDVNDKGVNEESWMTFSSIPDEADDILVITCPADITLECAESTMPANTGNPVVNDPCDPTPTINFYDYTLTSPADGSEMRWVYLPPGGVTGSCSSGTDCQTGTICIGLQYTPAVSGLLSSYTTGFFLNCYNGNDPIISNASCVMADNSGYIEDCANSGMILMNSSGNSGAFPVQQYVPVIIHQVCLQLGSGGNILFDEDEATDLTTSIELEGGGSITESPVYTNFTVDFDQYCSTGCKYPLTIYRRFVVTDDCDGVASCEQQITLTDTTPPDLTCPPDITIIYPASTNPANTGLAYAVDGCDPDAMVTYQDSIPSGYCPSANFIQRTWHAVDNCGNQSSCVQWISIHDQGSICGSVHDDIGQPVGGIQIELYADLNNNLMQDGGDTLVTSTTTDLVDGSFCFTEQLPCHYVLVEIQAANFFDISDFDSSPDPDGDDSADGPDNQIPVDLSQSENDMDNDFVDLICPDVLPGLPFDTICSGQSETIMVTGFPYGAPTYTWDFGSGSTPGTGIGAGAYTITYTSTPENQLNGASVMLTISKNGCADVAGEVTHINVNPVPNAAINVNTSTACYYTDKIFQPVAPPVPGATYNWNFGASAVPSTAIGYGPHTVYYTIPGSKTAKLVIHPNDPGAACPDSSTVSFTITNCPAQILGYIKSDLNIPVTDVTVKLFADTNHDGIADNGVAIRNVTSSATGLYTMASLTPGSYVIVETQPSGWISVDDYDNSDDGDLAVNISGTDNLIPVTLLPNEVDSMNNFIEMAQAGTITGSVFVDADGDMSPDAGEGLDNVTLQLFTDNNLDGVADNNTPVAVQTTDPIGSFIFSSIAIGSYVLVEINPAEYISVKDFDPTNDGDAVPNTNMNNDTIPVTMTNGENDANNYFIDKIACPLVVTSNANSGYGTIRYIVDCASPDDTITFSPDLAGQTILLTSQQIDLTKNLVILSTLTPRLTISSAVPGLFNVLSGVTVEFWDLNLIGGDSTGPEGAAFDNLGHLKLYNVTIAKNPSFPGVERLIRNQTNSSLFLSGTCILEN